MDSDFGLTNIRQHVGGSVHWHSANLLKQKYLGSGCGGRGRGGFLRGDKAVLTGGLKLGRTCGKIAEGKQLWGGN
jgi:hypothetical protein